MEINENILQQILSKLDGLDTKVSGLDTKVSGLDAKVSGLDAKVSGLDAKVFDLDTKVSGLDTKVSGLDAKVAELAEGLKETNLQMRKMQKMDSMILDEVERVHDIMLRRTDELSKRIG